MKLKVSFKMVIAVVAGAVILAGVVAVFSSPTIRSMLGALKDKLPGSFESGVEKIEEGTEAGVVVDVPEKIIATEKPDLILNHSANINNSTTNIPVFPVNQLPWQQGPSQQ